MTIYSPGLKFFLLLVFFSVILLSYLEELMYEG